jgi:hypothetical protein
MVAALFRRRQAVDELGDPADGFHQAFVGRGVAEADLAVAVVAEGSAA